MVKKGQVTLFIIVGLVILLMVVLVLITNSDFLNKDSSTKDYIITESTLDSLEFYISECIYQKIKQGLFLYGLDNLTIVKQYLEDNLTECIDSINGSQNIIISEGNISSDLFLTDNNDSIIFDMDYNIKLSRNKITSELLDFYIKYPLTSITHINTTLGGVLQEEVNILSGDNIVKLEIADGIGALDGAGDPIDNITIAIIDITSLNDHSVGLVGYDLQPDGATFDPAIEISMKYDEEIIPEYLNESNFTLSYFDGVEWTTVPSVVDTVNNIIKANITHFTTWTMTTPDPVGTANNDFYWKLYGSGSTSYNGRKVTVRWPTVLYDDHGCTCSNTYTVVDGITFNYQGCVYDQGSSGDCSARITHRTDQQYGFQFPSNVEVKLYKNGQAFACVNVPSPASKWKTDISNIRKCGTTQTFSASASAYECPGAAVSCSVGCTVINCDGLPCGCKCENGNGVPQVFTGGSGTGTGGSGGTGSGTGTGGSGSGTGGSGASADGNNDGLEDGEECSKYGFETLTSWTSGQCDTHTSISARGGSCISGARHYCDDTSVQYITCKNSNTEYCNSIDDDCDGIIDENC